MPPTLTAHPDRPATLAAVVALAAIVPAMLLVAPLVVGALITRAGFTPQQAGYIISIELGTMAVATLPALWWMPRADWRRVVQACLAVMVVGNLLSLGATSFAALAPLRCLTGLAGGTVMVVCLALIGASAAQERNFGWWVTGQLAFGAIAVELLPRLLPRFGLAAVYCPLAAILFLLLLVTPALDRGAGARVSSSAGRRPLDRRGFIGLAAVFVFYVSLSGVWAYVERVGAQEGLAPQQIGDDLMVATLFGIAGCLTATGLGGRFGHRLPLVVGYALLVAATLALYGSFGNAGYLLATSAFKYAWTFALPFILVCLSAQDPGGRLVVLANLMIGAGLAAGPAISALNLGAPPDYRTTLPIGAAGAVLSFLLIQVLARKSAEAPRAAR